MADFKVLSHPSSRGNWSISKPEQQGTIYELALVSLTDPDRLQRYLKVNNIISEFRFPISPKMLAISEPAAVTLQPTQGGVYSERKHTFFRDIQISGTTGMRPNRGAGGVVPVFGINIRLPDFSLTDFETGLPRGERTGFDDLIDLRNMIRAYSELVEDPDFGNNVVLVWRNHKEGDYFIVELINFTTRRDASSERVTAAYDIALRAIDHADSGLGPAANDPFSTLKKGVQLYQDVLRITTSVFVSLQSFQGFFASIGVKAVSTVLQPVGKLINAVSGYLTSVSKTAPAIEGFTRQSYNDLVNNINILQEQLNDESSVYTTSGQTSQIALAANSCNQLIRAVSTFAASDLFTSPVSSAISRKAAAYSNPITGTVMGGTDRSFIGNAAGSNSVAESTVFGGDTIYTVSQRLLGDRNRWKELVVLNQLRAPYISTDGDGISVLRPNDAILYPSGSTGTSANTAITKDSRFRNTSPLDDRLGTDLKLVASKAIAGVVRYDLAQDSSGDLATISGPSNLSQAMVIKFNTEQGELPAHPKFGGLFNLGRKATVASVAQFNINVRSTILSDRRIQSIASLKTSTTGNTISIAGTVNVKGIDQQIPINFEG